MPLILPKVTLAAAISPALIGPVFQIEPGDLRSLMLEAEFVRAGGGTSFDAWVQTSCDGGLSYFDIANFHFTTSTASALLNLSSATPQTTQLTPGDGTLASNTCVDGLIGDFLRVKYSSVGTYTGASSVLIAASGARLRVA